MISRDYLTMHGLYLFLALMAMNRISTVSAVVECFACSYTFSGTDGTTDYECVSDVLNFDKMTRINCTSNMCLTRTVYTQDYQRINSLTRGCGFAAADQCDAPNSVYPTCEVTCTTRFCNDKNGDTYASRDNNACSLIGPSVLVLSLALIMSLILMKVNM